MEKRLMFTRPLINCWSYQAALMGILQSHIACYDWIFSNYIQVFSLKDLYSDDRSYALDFYWGEGADWQYYEHKTNPWIDYFKVPRQIVIEKWSNPHEFVLDQVDSDRYVYIALNTDCLAKHTLDYYHTVLVIGYDSDKKVLYCADNCKLGKFGEFECSFDEFDAAVLSNDNFTELTKRSDDYDVTLLSVRSAKMIDSIVYSKPYRLNKEKITSDLQWYVAPCENNRVDHDNYVYGSACFDVLQEVYRKSFTDKRKMDLRPLSCFIDHKRLMDARVQYLLHKGLLPKDHSQYTSIRGELEKLRFYLLRVNIENVFSFDAWSEVSVCISKCRETEKRALEWVLNSIE